MDMTFSADNRAEILVLPFVSLDTSVDEPQNNDTFTGLSRDINLIGTMGLRTLTINSWFPDHPLRFGNQSAPIGAQTYIQFFRRVWSGQVRMAAKSSICRVRSIPSAGSLPAAWGASVTV